MKKTLRFLQFLSYRGVVTGIEGLAKGLVSKDVGVQEGGNSPTGSSIAISGAGRRYQDFKCGEFSRTPSPESVNSEQLIS